MEVVRITPRGYCHGVVDAFRIAKRVREETNGPVHMLGMLVHNTHATDDLQAQGIALVDPPDRLAGLEQIKDGTATFTAHGVSPPAKQRPPTPAPNPPTAPPPPAPPPPNPHPPPP